MRRSLSLSAILSSLLATPLLAAPPVRQQYDLQGAPVVIPASEIVDAALPLEAEFHEQFQGLLNGRPLDAHGMQQLHQQMALATQEHLSRVMLLQRQFAGHPELFPIQLTQAGAVQVHHLEKAAFLGITTSPATPILRDQLNIARGTGLVVDFIESDSPAAAAGLRMHDILQKLDDQVLINPQQLAVLVRSKKPGDKLDLTILREGQSMTLSATLAEKELPVLEELQDPNLFFNPAVPLREFDLPGPGAFVGATPHSTSVSVHINADGSQERKYLDDQNEITLTSNADKSLNLLVKDRAGHVLYEGPTDKAIFPADLKAKIDTLKAADGATITLNPNAEAGAEAVKISRTDDDYQITLRTDSHGRTLTVKDIKADKLIFDGPANSNQDLSSLPPAALERVKALEDKAKLLHNGTKNEVPVHP